MQVSVEKTGPCEAKVSFTVPRDVFDREYAAALKASGKDVRMKGFRPGKVPTAVLEKEFGEQVRLRAVEHFMGKAYEQAIEENELNPVGHERVPLENVDLSEGVDIQHTFEVSLRPEFELGEYKGLEVTSELEPVLEEEIQEAIDDLRLQQSTPSPAGDDGIPEDGQAMCRVVWVHDGETVLERESLRMAPLAPPPGVDPDAFKEQLTGAHDGDEFELEMAIPDDYEDEKIRGAAAICKVTVQEGYAMAFPPDEELWKLLEAENEEDFKKRAAERMGLAKQSQENGRQETVLLEGLLETYQFELPERMVEGQTESRRRQLREQLTQSGVPEEELDAKVAEKDEESADLGRKSVRALFLINSIAEKETMTVEESDMVAEMQQIAQRHQAKVDDVVEYYRKNNLFQQLQVELLERKVRVFLRENAKITEP